MDARQDRCRTELVLDRADAGHEGCSIGRMQAVSGQDLCRTGRFQDQTYALQNGFRTIVYGCKQMQDRLDVGQNHKPIR